MVVVARGQPDRRVAANWEPLSRSQRGGARRAAAAGIRASGARTTLPTTGYDDGAPKHQGNAFATHPRASLAL